MARFVKTLLVGRMSLLGLIAREQGTKLINTFLLHIEYVVLDYEHVSSINCPLFTTSG